MEYMDRKTAKLRGLTSYFTGLPCKHGHLSFRYTLSGACAACVKEANNRSSDPHKDARKAVCACLHQVKFRLYHEDRFMFKSAVYAAAAMRSPILRESDVWPGLLPLDVGGGTGLYRAYCFEEDVPMLQQIVSDLIRAKAPDMEAARRQIHTALQEATPAAPVPGWADRP